VGSSLSLTEMSRSLGLTEFLAAPSCCVTDHDRIRSLFSLPSMVVASRRTHLQALTLLKLGFLTTLLPGSKYKSLSVAANETGVPEQSIPC
jgi:hypothetical protein